MARGSKPGERRGGRKAGTPNKRTAEMIKEMEAEGELPLAYALRIMRDPNMPPERRDHMCQVAMKHCHPTLASIEAQVQGSMHMTHEQMLDELDD